MKLVRKMKTTDLLFLVVWAILASFSNAYRSKVVTLLQFFFVCVSVASYFAFVIMPFSFSSSVCFWCLGRAVLRDCGISSRKHAYIMLTPLNPTFI